MKWIKNGFAYIRNRHALLSEKKYTTIAGTLVFFLLMSMMPLTFLITLLFGKTTVQIGRIAQFPFFGSLEEIFSYVQAEAARATNAASIFLVATTVYSSTNLFYQLRKSGELIYEVKVPHRGIKYRIDAFFVLLGVLISVIVLAFVLGLIAYLSARFLSEPMQILVNFAALLVVAFLVTLMLNAYLCPYRQPVFKFFKGAIITVAAWVVAGTAFGLYLKFSNFDRLYGALSAAIVFLLWLYVMTICFVTGAILNSERLENDEKQLKIIKKKKKR